MEVDSDACLPNYMHDLSWTRLPMTWDEALSNSAGCLPLPPGEIRKGVNTPAVEWRANTSGGAIAGNVLVQFNKAKTNKPVPELFFDMDRR
jgi:hypothetical protein